MTKQEAWNIVSGLSDPGKMPGYGYSLPANFCKTGGILRKIPGTVCSKCYAQKGRYVFSRVRNCLLRRYKALKDRRWIEAMSLLINSRRCRYFRWHDSGDIANKGHLAKIFAVCQNTPRIKHWLPTREIDLVRNYLKQHRKPANLVIRLSATLIDGPYPIKVEGCCFSAVSANGGYKDSYHCPVGKNGKKTCGTCRTCWNPNKTKVVYHLH